MAGQVEDLTGQRFGRLTVIRPDRPRRPNNRARWWCRCDCGTEKSILHGSLKFGTAVSCGCYQREVNRAAHTKHGFYGTPEYVIWVKMIQRCEDPNHPAYQHYGGKGVKPCARWRVAFVNFRDDLIASIGLRPSKQHTLDRWPDKNGNYEPGNVRWATWIEQANNRNPPKCQRLTLNGETHTVKEWSRITGLSVTTINWRLSHRWPVEKALAPILPQHRR